MTQLPFICLSLVLMAVATSADQGADPKTGEFELTTTVAQLVGERSAQGVADVIAPDEAISYSMYVPQNYDPAKPAGVMVYISPTPSGDIPDSWKAVLDSHNLIWIGANQSGNRVLVSRRVLFSLLAPTVIDQHYRRDNERIYISGLSGGGKTASLVATSQARLFKGAIYNCGVERWEVEDPVIIDEIRKNHFVFVTGEHDQAREPTKKVFRAYRKAGVENILLMDIRNMSHRNPDSFHFEEALEYLDSRIDQAL